MAYVQGQRVREEGQVVFKTQNDCATSGGLVTMLSNCHLF